ncbi:MAG: class I adenylate-forming enzyme family protein [Pseudomonadota bacterium]
MTETVSKLTFQGLFYGSCSAFPQNPLIVGAHDRTVFTYSEVAERVERIAALLTGLGIKKSETVVSCSPVSVESVLLCWACLIQGLVFIPVDHDWPQSLIGHVIDQTSPGLILTDNKRFRRMGNLVNRDKILLYGEADPAQGIFGFYEAMAGCRDRKPFPLEPAAPDDLAVVLYTSGSTGKPKGVMLSQHALLNSGRLISDCFRWEPQDRFMNLGDLHSMSGLRNTCIAPLIQGASLLVADLEDRRNVLAMIDRIQEFSITFLGVAPTMVRQMALVASPSRKARLSSLKAVLSTGAGLSQEALRLFYAAYGIPVLNYYGLTETAGICTAHTVDTFSPTDVSIGRPVGANITLARDLDLSRPGDVGELLVDSDNVMLGYYGNDLETASILKNRIIHTGDLARIRPDGCYELVGRKTNAVNTISSERIYLEEIEGALEACPEVQEACACRYLKAKDDERIVAFVVPAGDFPEPAQGFIDHLKKNLIDLLGKNRVPWFYYIETRLPRITTGKINRQALKERLDDNLRLQRRRYF